MLKFLNSRIFKFLAIGIIVVLLIIASWIVIVYSNLKSDPPQFPSSCDLSLNCEMKMDCGGCGWLCVDKDNYLPRICNPMGPICEYAFPPQDQICGCVNNQCQFSSELFRQYGEIKEKALDLVIFDYKEAMNYCSKLHGEYLLDCYSRIAEKVLTISASRADEICASIVDKYSVGSGEDCYYSLARKVVDKDPDLAINFCSKASEVGGPNEYSINNKNYCVRYIGLEIAKNNDLIKAFEVCNIEGLEGGEDFCKYYIIAQTYEYIDDPDVAFEKILEPDICEKADFSTDYKEWYELYYGECKNFYIMISASILAKDKKIEEALNMCNTIVREHVDDTVGDCYKKVAVAVSKYDKNEAQSICGKISVNSTEIECNQDILK